MRFELEGRFVIFHDDKPGSNAQMRWHKLSSTVFGWKTLRFNSDKSSFNDGKKEYAWAFECEGQGEGDLFTFSTNDRSIQGYVVNNEIHLDTENTTISSGPVRVYVGAGCDAKEWSKLGWRCNDIAEAAAVWPDIDLVGPCWELPLPNNSVDEIMAKGMIEHLTYHEVAKAFREWKRVLKPGGFFTGEVPDMDEYIRETIKMYQDPTTIGGEGNSQASRAEGEPDDFEVCTGVERWLRRAMYGWQRWPGDEHRSGWTERLFSFYIEKYFGGRHEVRRMGISFDEDVPGPQRVRHLWCRGWKLP